MFRVTVSGPREQEASFFTVVVWRDQAEHVAESLSKGRRIVVVSRLQQRSWTAEDSSARSIVEVVADAHAADGQPLVEQGRAHHAGQAGRRPPAHPRPRDGVRPQRHDHQSRAKLTSWDSSKTTKTCARRVRTPPAKSDTRRPPRRPGP